MAKPKVLFVCNCNCNRSPTFERYFKKFRPEWDIRSAGTLAGYPYIVTDELIEWADLIFVMDLEQAKRIDDYHPNKKPMVTIGISDEYEPDDERLIRLIDYWVNDKNFWVIDTLCNSIRDNDATVA